MTSERQILINLVAGLSLADHMRDVANDCEQALKLAGIEMPEGYNGSKYDGWWYQLSHYLSRFHGAETVWGTSLQEDDDDQ